MAKGPIVTDEVKTLIASGYLEHRDWRAKQIQKEVNARIRKNKPHISSEWPGLNTVQKVLATVRKNANEVDPQEKPWSMATLDQYPIPPGAIPAVLRVWKFRFENNKASFTIRQAKWVARLSGVEADTESLGRKASVYARMELVYYLLDRPFDSGGLDSIIEILR